MSNISSPTKFSGLEDHFYDHIDINEKMRVPRRIKVSGDHDNVITSSAPMPPWEGEKFDMKVPDRILVVGQEQCLETTAPPREVLLENAVMPPDPGLIRVQTPPRVITLSEHYFPTVEDPDDSFDVESMSSHHTAELQLSKPKPKIFPTETESRIVLPITDWSPVPAMNGAGDTVNRGLAPTEEMTHLRRQMAKLNRRLMAIELENLQRQQREKLFVALGLGYFLMKLVFWINRT